MIITPLAGKNTLFSGRCPTEKLIFLQRWRQKDRPHSLDDLNNELLLKNVSPVTHILSYLTGCDRCCRRCWGWRWVWELVVVSIKHTLFGERNVVQCNRPLLSITQFISEDDLWQKQKMKNFWIWLCLHNKKYFYSEISLIKHTSIGQI